MAGFLVPFATGALIERQRVADAYDEKSGEIIDTVSKKLTTQFDENQKTLALEAANYDAVLNALTMPIAEIAQRSGMLVDVNTAQVVDHVRDSLEKAHPGFIKWIQGKNIEDLKKTHPDFFENAFSASYDRAKTKLKSNREFTAKSMNGGAINSISKLFLGEEDKEPTGVEKAQKFLFGEPVTTQKGVAFESALMEEVGEPVRIESLEGRADLAVFSMVKEFYKYAGKEFKSEAELWTHGLTTIMKWNARSGENFFKLTDERKNEVGSEILPIFGNLQFYNQVYEKFFSDDYKKKMVADQLAKMPAWTYVNQAIVLAVKMGHTKDDKKALPNEVLNMVGKQWRDGLTDYDSLVNLSKAFEEQFKSLINTALDVAKDVESGDPAKVAERVGNLLTKLKFSDDLIVGDINEEDQSGIRGDFVTSDGTEWYVYRAPDGIHYAIAKNIELRLLKPPIRLSSAEVEKHLTKPQ
jgi:hypothetical protein